MSRFAMLLAAALTLFAGDALAFDHSRLDTLLRAHAVAGRVDYSALEAKNAELDAYLASVAAAPEPQKLGFYLNAYNALVIDALLAEPALPAKVTDIQGFFDGKKYTVAGRSLSLNELEAYIRKTFADPRVHFVLNCGAVSCPKLFAIALPEDDADLDRILRDATKRFLHDGGLVVDHEGKQLRYSKIFEWYKDEFDAKEGSVEAFVRKWMTDAKGIQGLDQGVAQGYAVTYLPYDWSVNAK